MIIDVNAYLGPFAFRRLRHNTAESLLKLMDARKIDRAVVSTRQRHHVPQRPVGQRGGRR